MDQEQLIKQIMAEVMANLGNDSVSFAKKEAAPSGGSTTSGGKVTKADYPLAERSMDKIKTASGKSLRDFSLDKVKSGELKAEDFRISAETLELQAQVADSVGRDTLARNFRRASELIEVPDDKLLAIYNALRPYRSTKEELYDIAKDLESQYDAKVNAAFIREAADVYEKRGRLKTDD